MRAAFADLPEACDNTLVIARRCSFIPQPRQPILPAFASGESQDEETALRRAALAGLEARLAAQALEEDGRQPYHDRLEFELGTIIRMGYAGYFLRLRLYPMGQASRDSGRPGARLGGGLGGRLGIDDHHLDPLRFGLLFERFLNPERCRCPISTSISARTGATR